VGGRRLQRCQSGNEADEQLLPSNDGADIEAAIEKSREELGALDKAGAHEILQDQISKEKEALEA
jgi:hypothetical protein